MVCWKDNELFESKKANYEGDEQTQKEIENDRPLARKAQKFVPENIPG